MSYFPEFIEKLKDRSTKQNTASCYEIRR